MSFIVIPPFSCHGWTVGTWTQLSDLRAGAQLAVVERRRPPQRRPDLVAGLLHLWRQGRPGGSREVLGQLVRARDTEQDAADERAAQQPAEGQLQQGQTGVAGYRKSSCRSVPRTCDVVTIT